MDFDDLSRPVEAVIAEERAHTYPVPLKIADRRELFAEWCRLNPAALHEIELTALAIDARDMRVSTKYLIEKQRYEGRVKLVPVPFFDGNGVEHAYGINNSDTSILARWLLERHPRMNIQLRESIFDSKEKKDDEA